VIKLGILHPTSMHDELRFGGWFSSFIVGYNFKSQYVKCTGFTYLNTSLVLWV